MKQQVSRLFLIILLMGCCRQLNAQTPRILVNAFDTLYQFTGGIGSCTYSPVNFICPAAVSEGIYSSALYTDIFYFITGRNNNLYRVKMGTPGCTLLTNFPTTGPFAGSSSINSLTVDKNGLLYCIDNHSLDLYQFNPYTKEKKLLGKVPARPGGDMIFYEDKLLLSTLSSGIYEINLQDPPASTPYMSTGNFYFFGLISFPYECNKNKVYGLSPAGLNTNLVELDLVNKTVTGVVCAIPINVYDAASIVETGNTIGIRVDSIIIDAPCGPAELTGDVKIIGYSASSGDLTYTLNNTLVNTTGEFTGLPVGTQQLRITNSLGCFKDTSFVITHGLSSNIQVVTSDPESCDLQNGSINVLATSYYQPVSFSFNNGPPQTNSTITNLAAGLYKISISDQGNCRRDTSVTLSYKIRPVFLGDITVSPTICESSSGSITVSVNGSAEGITASLNNSNPQSSLQFDHISYGYHLLSIYKTGSCRYDTVIQIERLADPKPAIQMVKTDQVCYDNNGTVTMQVTGTGAPFSYSFNNAVSTTVPTFNQLAPGIYPVKISNSNTCSWDTAVEIKAYPYQPVNYTVTKTDANCKVLNSGQVIINVTGNEPLYYLSWNNQLYTSGEKINAPAGEHVIKILNRDKCLVDTVRVKLDLLVEPECDRVSMPNAFSPNNDGHNDVFKPLHGPYIRNVALTIYNRYGQVVFRSTAVKPGWDGSLQGRPQDQGLYIWTLGYENYAGTRKTMHGRVLLVR